MSESNVIPMGETGNRGYRPLPRNVAAEKCLLGAIFANNRAYERVSDFLQPDHFWMPEHARIFKACQTLIDHGQGADLITLQALFEQENALQAIGGTKYLADLAGSAVTIINAGHYGRIICDLHMKRELITALWEAEEEAFASNTEVKTSELVEGAERRLFELSEGTASGSGSTIRGFDSVTRSALMRAEEVRSEGTGILGHATGLHDLDRILGGLAPSNMVVLGARPAVGKTSLGLAIATHLVRRGVPVGFFSLEMSAEQLSYRLMANQASIAQDEIARGTAHNWEPVEQAAKDIEAWPLHIDDTAGLDIAQIRNRARRMKRKHGVSLIIIDHMQLVHARAENRTQEITKISGGLKVLAKELDVPVLVLCQLNRGLENRDDKRPTLADLRESGSIEQDADAVMFLYREAYYLERNQPRKTPDQTASEFVGKLADWQAEMDRVKNEADVFVAKNRHGRTGEARLFFAPELSRFGSQAHEGGKDILS